MAWGRAGGRAAAGGGGHGSAAVQHNNANVPLHQMTASAVGNTPERDIDKVKEVLMRGVMHADERLFSFKVRCRRPLLVVMLALSLFCCFVGVGAVLFLFVLLFVVVVVAVVFALVVGIVAVVALSLRILVWFRRHP